MSYKTQAKNHILNRSIKKEFSLNSMYTVFNRPQVKQRKILPMDLVVSPSNLSVSDLSLDIVTHLSHSRRRSLDVYSITGFTPI